jgi:hypothetical protein
MHKIALSMHILKEEKLWFNTSFEVMQQKSFHFLISIPYEESCNVKFTLVLMHNQHCIFVQFQSFITNFHLQETKIPILIIFSSIFYSFF